jgi:CRP-like cAMP-binding protein
VIESPFLNRRLRSHTILGDDDLRLLQELPASIRNVPAAETIISEGTRQADCCIILRGLVCRSKTTDIGKRQILSFHIPGDIPDLQSLLLPQLDHDITALSDATIGLVRHVDLAALIDANRRIATVLWRECLTEAAVNREWIVNVGRRSGEAKLAHMVAELKRRMEAVGLAEGDTFPFPATQADIADALGLTTVHVNRILRVLRARRVLDIRHREVVIHDWPKLVAIAGFRDNYLHAIGA